MHSPAKAWPPLINPPHIFYGWWLALITAFILAVTVSPLMQGLGTFFVALEDEYGWSRTALAGAFALARAEDAAIGPIAGYLTDRLGTRRLVFIGFLTLGVGFIFLSVIQSIVQFYLAFVVLTFGMGFASFLPMMGALNHWFIRRRSTAMGIGQTGFSIGGLLVPALAFSVTSFGWRETSVGLAILMWVLAFPMYKLIRNRPEPYGQLPDGDPPLVEPNPTATPDHGDTPTDAANESAGEVNFTAGQALRAPAFWLVSLSHAFAAVAVLTLAIHIIPMLTDRGISMTLAATVVAVYTGAQGVFQLIGGYIGDRIPKRLGIAVFVSIQALGITLLALTESLPLVFLFAILVGIGSGGRVPLLIAIRGDYFGRRAFATIFGLTMIPMGIVMLIGPIGAGYLYDVLGSYKLAFLILGGMNLFAMVLILLARRPKLTLA